MFPAYSRILYSQESWEIEGGNWIFLGAFDTAPVKKRMGEGIGSRYPIDTYAKPRPVVAPSVHEWTHGHLRNYSPSRASLDPRPHEVVTVGHESRQRVRHDIAPCAIHDAIVTSKRRSNVVFMSCILFFSLSSRTIFTNCSLSTRFHRYFFRSRSNDLCIST